MQFCLSFSPGNSSTHTMWGYRDLAKSYFVLLPGYSTPGQLCEMKRGFINPDTSVMNQDEIKRRQRGDEKGGVKPVPQGILNMAWQGFSQNKQEKNPIISIYTLLPRICIYEKWNSPSDESISIMSYFSVSQNIQDVHCFFSLSSADWMHMQFYLLQFHFMETRMPVFVAKEKLCVLKEWKGLRYKAEVQLLIVVSFWSLC